MPPAHGGYGVPAAMFQIVATPIAAQAAPIPIASSRKRPSRSNAGGSGWRRFIRFRQAAQGWGAEGQEAGGARGAAPHSMRPRREQRRQGRRRGSRRGGDPPSTAGTRARFNRIAQAAARMLSTKAKAVKKEEKAKIKALQRQADSIKARIKRAKKSAKKRIAQAKKADRDAKRAAKKKARQESKTGRKAAKEPNKVAKEPKKAAAAGPSGEERSGAPAA